ncbi:MAG TPA: hypothetical protein VGR12_07800, partial [Solirubrobacteraceae bacterium]|nr:hypothetical protein [Solirubrobacteraceae bacterium]
RHTVRPWSTACGCCIGELDGVKLTFSDATPLPGDVLMFTAARPNQPRPVSPPPPGFYGTLR